MTTDWYTLSCNACHRQQSVAGEELVDQLRSLGRLRRQAKPSRELILELLSSGTLSLSCPDCGSQLTGTNSQEPNDDEWGSAEADPWAQERRCATCKQPLDPDRLELFPDTTQCAGCLSRPESDPSDAELGYCAHCGDRLAIQQTTGSRVSGYQLRCQGCGRSA